MTDDELSRLEGLCEAATPGPWHYYPCGDQSNDCLLGVAVDDHNDSPPPGEVELHPYNEDTHDYEMQTYILDPVIASRENDAKYADFCFMAVARTALPTLLGEVRTLTVQRVDLALMLRRALRRMKLYEMDVDTEAPRHHRQFIAKARALLDKYGLSGSPLRKEGD